MAQLLDSLQRFTEGFDRGVKSSVPFLPTARGAQLTRYAKELGQAPEIIRSLSRGFDQIAGPLNSFFKSLGLQ